MKHIIYFNPLPPHGGRLFTSVMVDIILYISIHSLRMEGDADAVFIFQEYSISIHSLRMEGDFTGVTPEMECEISIHSLRMEGDAMKDDTTKVSITISIHSLRMEGDHRCRKPCRCL